MLHYYIIAVLNYWLVHDNVMCVHSCRCAAYLIRHLAKIADQHEETRMDSKNLAIVWAPNLLK
jgi:hypothetical protein